MKITIVHTPKNKPNGKWCPWMIDAPVDDFDPKQWLSSAVLASLAANELARSMGMRDLYPFALSAGARRRIEAAWHLVHNAAASLP